MTRFQRLAEVGHFTAPLFVARPLTLVTKRRDLSPEMQQLVRFLNQHTVLVVHCTSCFQSWPHAMFFSVSWIHVLASALRCFPVVVTGGARGSEEKTPGTIAAGRVETISCTAGIVQGLERQPGDLFDPLSSARWFFRPSARSRQLFPNQFFPGMGEEMLSVSTPRCLREM